MTLNRAAVRRLLVLSPVAGLSLMLLLPAVLGAAPSIRQVRLSRPFFNPSLRQSVEITIEVSEAGELSASVLDRDGFLVRQLTPPKQVDAGRVVLAWDGRNEQQRAVPDEAYSLKIDLTGKSGSATYFPANLPTEKVQVETKYYDRRSAVLSYHLPKPARIHLQAGTAIVDPRTKTTNGPVLKTLVNREPRPAGAVVENWNGLDESGTTYVPDLPHFVVGIAASSLPENSIITYGNRTSTFSAWAAKRTGTPLFKQASNDHRHHQGLTTLDDVAPRLDAKVQNATWSGRTRTWTTNKKTLKVQLALRGASAAAFAKHPSKLVVYLDQTLVAEVSKPESGMSLEIPTRGVKAGSHLVALNWASAYGPVAVQTILISRGVNEMVPAAAQGGGKR